MRPPLLGWALLCLLYAAAQAQPSGAASPTTLAPPTPVAASPSPTGSGSPTATATASVTSSVTLTSSITRSVTRTSSGTPSSTLTPSVTPSGTPSMTASASLTPSASRTPSLTPSVTPSPGPFNRPPRVEVPHAATVLRRGVRGLAPCGTAPLFTVPGPAVVAPQAAGSGNATASLYVPSEAIPFREDEALPSGERFPLAYGGSGASSWGQPLLVSDPDGGGTIDLGGGASAVLQPYDLLASPLLVSIPASQCPDFEAMNGRLRLDTASLAFQYFVASLNATSASKGWTGKNAGLAPLQAQDFRFEWVGSATAPSTTPSPSPSPTPSGTATASRTPSRPRSPAGPTPTLAFTSSIGVTATAATATFFPSSSAMPSPTQPSTTAAALEVSACTLVVTWAQRRVGAAPTPTPTPIAPDKPVPFPCTSEALLTARQTQLLLASLALQVCDTEGVLEKRAAAAQGLGTGLEFSVAVTLRDQLSFGRRPACTNSTTLLPHPAFTVSYSAPQALYTLGLSSAAASKWTVTRPGAPRTGGAPAPVETTVVPVVLPPAAPAAAAAAAAFFAGTAPLDAASPCASSSTSCARCIPAEVATAAVPAFGATAIPHLVPASDAPLQSAFSASLWSSGIARALATGVAPPTDAPGAFARLQQLLFPAGSPSLPATSLAPPLLGLRIVLEDCAAPDALYLPSPAAAVFLAGVQATSRWWDALDALPLADATGFAPSSSNASFPPAVWVALRQGAVLPFQPPSTNLAVYPPPPRANVSSTASCSSGAMAGAPTSGFPASSSVWPVTYGACTLALLGRAPREIYQTALAALRVAFGPSTTEYHPRRLQLYASTSDMLRVDEPLGEVLVRPVPRAAATPTASPSPAAAAAPQMGRAGPVLTLRQPADPSSAVSLNVTLSEGAQTWIDVVVTESCEAWGWPAPGTTSVTAPTAPDSPTLLCVEHASAPPVLGGRSFAALMQSTGALSSLVSNASAVASWWADERGVVPASGYTSAGGVVFTRYSAQLAAPLPSSASVLGAATSVYNASSYPLPLVVDAASTAPVLLPCTQVADEVLAAVYGTSVPPGVAPQWPGRGIEGAPPCWRLRLAVTGWDLENPLSLPPANATLPRPSIGTSVTRTFVVPWSQPTPSSSAIALSNFTTTAQLLMTLAVRVDVLPRDEPPLLAALGGTLAPLPFTSGIATYQDRIKPPTLIFSENAGDACPVQILGSGLYTEAALRGGGAAMAPCWSSVVVNASATPVGNAWDQLLFVAVDPEESAVQAGPTPLLSSLSMTASTPSGNLTVTNTAGNGTLSLPASSLFQLVELSALSSSALLSLGLPCPLPGCRLRGFTLSPLLDVSRLATKDFTLSIAASGSVPAIDTNNPLSVFSSVVDVRVVITRRNEPVKGIALQRLLDGRLPAPVARVSPSPSPSASASPAPQRSPGTSVAATRLSSALPTSSRVPTRLTSGSPALASATVAPAAATASPSRLPALVSPLPSAFPWSADDVLVVPDKAEPQLPLAALTMTDDDAWQGAARWLLRVVPEASMTGCPDFEGAVEVAGTPTQSASNNASWPRSITLATASLPSEVWDMDLLPPACLASLPAASDATFSLALLRVALEVTVIDDGAAPAEGSSLFSGLDAATRARASTPPWSSPPRRVTSFTRRFRVVIARSASTSNLPVIENVCGLSGGGLPTSGGARIELQGNLLALGPRSGIAVDVGIWSQVTPWQSTPSSVALSPSALPPPSFVWTLSDCFPTQRLLSLSCSFPHFLGRGYALRVRVGVSSGGPGRASDWAFPVTSVLVSPDAAQVASCVPAVAPAAALTLLQRRLQNSTASALAAEDTMQAGVGAAPLPTTDLSLLSTLPVASLTSQQTTALLAYLPHLGALVDARLPAPLTPSEPAHLGVPFLRPALHLAASTENGIVDEVLTAFEVVGTHLPAGVSTSQTPTLSFSIAGAVRSLPVQLACASAAACVSSGPFWPFLVILFDDSAATNGGSVVAQAAAESTASPSPLASWASQVSSLPQPSSSSSTSTAPWLPILPPGSTIATCSVVEAGKRLNCTAVRRAGFLNVAIWVGGQLSNPLSIVLPPPEVVAVRTLSFEELVAGGDDGIQAGITFPPAARAAVERALASPRDAWPHVPSSTKGGRWVAIGGRGIPAVVDDAVVSALSLGIDKVEYSADPAITRNAMIGGDGKAGVCGPTGLAPCGIFRASACVVVRVTGGNTTTTQAATSPSFKPAASATRSVASPTAHGTASPAPLGASSTPADASSSNDTAASTDQGQGFLPPSRSALLCRTVPGYGSLPFAWRISIAGKLSGWSALANSPPALYTPPVIERWAVVAAQPGAGIIPVFRANGTGVNGTAAATLEAGGLPLSTAGGSLVLLEGRGFFSAFWGAGTTAWVPTSSVNTTGSAASSAADAADSSVSITVGGVLVDAARVTVVSDSVLLLYAPAGFGVVQVQVRVGATISPPVGLVYQRLAITSMQWVSGDRSSLSRQVKLIGTGLSSCALCLEQVPYATGGNTTAVRQRWATACAATAIATRLQHCALPSSFLGAPAEVPGAPGLLAPRFPSSELSVGSSLAEVIHISADDTSVTFSTSASEGIVTLALGYGNVPPAERPLAVTSSATAADPELPAPASALYSFSSLLADQPAIIKWVSSPLEWATDGSTEVTLEARNAGRFGRVMIETPSGAVIPCLITGSTKVFAEGRQIVEAINLTASFPTVRLGERQLVRIPSPASSDWLQTLGYTVGLDTGALPPGARLNNTAVGAQPKQAPQHTTEWRAYDRIGCRITQWLGEPRSSGGDFISFRVPPLFGEVRVYLVVDSQITAERLLGRYAKPVTTLVAYPLLPGQTAQATSADGGAAPSRGSTIEVIGSNFGVSQSIKGLLTAAYPLPTNYTDADLWWTAMTSAAMFEAPRAPLSGGLLPLPPVNGTASVNFVSLAEERQCKPVFWSDDLIQCDSGDGVPGSTSTVVIRRPAPGFDGAPSLDASTVSARSVYVVRPPELLDVQPRTGPAKGGYLVLLRGRNLGRIPVSGGSGSSPAAPLRQLLSDGQTATFDTTVMSLHRMSTERVGRRLQASPAAASPSLPARASATAAPAATPAHTSVTARAASPSLAPSYASVAPTASPSGTCVQCQGSASPSAKAATAAVSRQPIPVENAPAPLPSVDAARLIPALLAAAAASNASSTSPTTPQAWQLSVRVEAAKDAAGLRLGLVEGQSLSAVEAPVLYSDHDAVIFRMPSIEGRVQISLAYESIAREVVQSVPIGFAADPPLVTAVAADTDGDLDADPCAALNATLPTGNSSIPVNRPSAAEAAAAGVGTARCPAVARATRDWGSFPLNASRPCFRSSLSSASGKGVTLLIRGQNFGSGRFAEAAVTVAGIPCLPSDFQSVIVNDGLIRCFLPSALPRRDVVDMSILVAFTNVSTEQFGIVPAAVCPCGTWSERDGAPCQPCLTGSTCAGVVDPPRAVADYWEVIPSAWLAEREFDPVKAELARFVPCPVGGLCVADSTCLPGSTGAMCTSCLEGYARGYSGACLECNASAAPAFIATVTMLAVFLVATLLLYKRGGKKGLRRLSMAVLTRPSSAAFKPMKTGVQHCLRGDCRRAFACCRKRRLHPKSNEALTAEALTLTTAAPLPGPGNKDDRRLSRPRSVLRVSANGSASDTETKNFRIALLKLIVTYAQTLSAISAFASSSVMKVQPPDAPQLVPAWLGSFDIVTDFGAGLQSVKCAVKPDFFAKSYTTVLLPFSAAVVLPVVLGTYALLRIHVMRYDHPLPYIEKHQIVPVAAYTVTVAVFLLMPVAIKAAARLQSCSDMASGYYLLDEPSISCASPRYRELASTAQGLGYTYMALPVLAGILLMARQRAALVYLKFLTAAYRLKTKDLWPPAWECVVLLRKSFFVGISSSFLILKNRYSQLSAISIIMALALLGHAMVKPYESQRVNLLEGLSLLGALCLTASVSVRLSLYGGNASGSDTALQRPPNDTSAQELLVFDLLSVLMNMPFIAMAAFFVLDEASCGRLRTNRAMVWLQKTIKCRLNHSMRKLLSDRSLGKGLLSGRGIVQRAAAGGGGDGAAAAAAAIPTLVSNPLRATGVSSADQMRGLEARTPKVAAASPAPLSAGVLAAAQVGGWTDPNVLRRGPKAAERVAPLPSAVGAVGVDGGAVGEGVVAPPASSELAVAVPGEAPASSPPLYTPRSPCASTDDIVSPGSTPFDASDSSLVSYNPLGVLPAHTSLAAATPVAATDSGSLDVAPAATSATTTAGTSALPHSSELAVAVPGEAPASSPPLYTPRSPCASTDDIVSPGSTPFDASDSSLVSYNPLGVLPAHTLALLSFSLAAATPVAAKDSGSLDVAPAATSAATTAGTSASSQGSPGSEVARLPSHSMAPRSSATGTTRPARYLQEDVGTQQNKVLFGPSVAAASMARRGTMSLHRVPRAEPVALQARAGSASLRK